VASRVVALDATTDLQQELERLRVARTRLEVDLERAENALCRQELYILEGYLVAVWPAGDGTFIARCPTLHAVADGDSSEAAIASLREAICAVRDGHASLGRPLPPKDVEARCLD
jgi:predicted RNase H-like HicB family nuclease